MSKEPPKDLTHDPERPWYRETARNIREFQWHMMEAMVEHGQVWVTPWNQGRRPQAPDTFRFGLLDWNEHRSWFNEQHPDWFEHGEWDNERGAAPIRLTDAGQQALQERERYDMEPMFGGMVEPGFMVTPAPRRQRRFRVFHDEDGMRWDNGELACFDNGGLYRRQARLRGFGGKIELEEITETADTAAGSL